MITHVVIFWVDGEKEKAEKLLTGTAMLADIPGVMEFRRGRPVPSERAVVDGSYSVAISMSFKDQETADTYQDHPTHVEFVEGYAKPLVSRLVVYDFGL